MDDRVELLWRFLKDNLDHSRHHEMLRATATNITVAVSAGGFAVVGFDKCISSADLPLLVFLFFLGLFGAVFAAAQTERAARHYSRARELSEEIDRSAHAPSFRSIKEKADLKHERNYRYLSKLRLAAFWMSIHISISLLSIALVVMWVLGSKCPS